MACDTLVEPRCACPRPLSAVMASYCSRCGRTLAGIVASSTPTGTIELAAVRSPLSSRGLVQVHAVEGRSVHALAVLDLAAIDAIDVPVALQRLLLLTKNQMNKT